MASNLLDAQQLIMELSLVLPRVPRKACRLWPKDTKCHDLQIILNPSIRLTGPA